MGEIDILLTFGSSRPSRLWNSFLGIMKAAKLAVYKARKTTAKRAQIADMNLKIELKFYEWQFVKYWSRIFIYCRVYNTLLHMSVFVWDWRPFICLKTCLTQYVSSKQTRLYIFSNSPIQQPKIKRWHYLSAIVIEADNISRIYNLQLTLYSSIFWKFFSREMFSESWKLFTEISFWDISSAKIF